jgi:hypothetical protein
MTTDRLSVWAKVPAFVLDTSIGKPALRLFIAMSAHADGEGRLCYAGQNTLALDCVWGVSKDGLTGDTRRVRRGQEELTAWDLIRPAGRHVWADGVWTNQYLIAPYPDGEPLWKPDRAAITRTRDRVTTTRTDDDAERTTGLSGTSRPGHPVPTTGSPQPDNQTHPSDPPSDPQKPALVSQARVGDNTQTKAEKRDRRAEAEEFYRAQILTEEEARKASADAS